MSRTLTAVYKMLVYSDGQVELHPQPLDAIFEELELPPIQVQSPRVSERIRQVMGVVAHVHGAVCQGNLWGTLSLSMLGKQVGAAYKKVAAENGIAQQTVADKCCRQLGLSQTAFTALLLDYLEQSARPGGDYTQTRLYKTAAKNVSTVYDLSHIQDCFAQMAAERGEEA